MKTLRERFRLAHEKFGVTYEELAEASPYAASTIEIYLGGHRPDLQEHTTARFVAEINAALDRILEGRARLVKEA